MEGERKGDREGRKKGEGRQGGGRRRGEAAAQRGRPSHPRDLPAERPPAQDRKRQVQAPSRPPCVSPVTSDLRR